MSEDTSTASAAPTTGRPGHPQWMGRLRRLMLKELRETLRDRRTIITLVVMPTLIYPLLALAFQRFLLTSVSVSQDVHYVIGVAPEAAGKSLYQQLIAGSVQLAAARRAEETRQKENGRQPADGKHSRPHLYHSGDGQPGETAPQWDLYPIPAEDIARHIGDSTLHLAVLAREDLDKDPEQGLEWPRTWELVYRAGSPTSEAAMHFVEARLNAVNAAALDAQLKQLGVTAVLEAPTTRRAIEFTGAPVFSLAALIPLVLVLMTVTGAVYPAIDLTAGERERGTLEMLIAAPVPRLGLLFAKYVAVLTVAVITAVVNLIGMTITAHSTGLATALFGAQMSFGVIGKVLILLALFAAFFSAILLAITSYARSFKEAQAYIIPLMLLCLVPGVLCLLPSLEFKGWMAVTPLVNMIILGRDLLEGGDVRGLAIASVCSTIFYIGAAIALAARIFGTDAILYGSQATWSDLVQRPRQPQPTATFPVAMLCLAVMFPTYFILANNLGRAQSIPMDQRLLIGDGISALVLGGIPFFLGMFNRLQWRT